LSLTFRVEEAAPLLGCFPITETAPCSASRGGLVLFGRNSCYAEEDCGKEETSHRGPEKGKSVLANGCCLTVRNEIIPSHNVGSRHKRCNDGLEEECDSARYAGEKAPNSAAQGEEAKEQRADSKEEGDEHECEHEPCQVVERVSTLESSWYALGRSKVTLRVKWICRANFWTDIRSIGTHAADVPESPSRLSRRAGYPRGVCLKKINCIDRIGIDGAGEEDEEYENAGTGDQD